MGCVCEYPRALYHVCVQGLQQHQARGKQMPCIASVARKALNPVLEVCVAAAPVETWTIGAMHNS